MSRLILLFFVLKTSIVLACSCLRGSFPQDYIDAKSVAVVKVLETKNIESTDSFRRYIAKVETIKTYKGLPTSEIKLLGSVEYAYSGACEVSVKPGEVLLIMSNSLDYKVGAFSSCSSMFSIDPDLKSKTNYSLTYYTNYFSVLDKVKAMNLPYEFSLWRNGIILDKEAKTITNYFNAFKLPKNKNRFGVFLFDLDKNGWVKTIDVVYMKQKKLDPKLIEQMKKSILVENINETPANKKYLVFIDFNKDLTAEINGFQQLP